jgi:pimeloyl-ACP methyl ester carboxylesterase
MTTATGNRAVILLHGLGRSRAVMRRMERRCQQSGWTVANVGYPSLRKPLASNVDLVRATARALNRNGAQQISFVGHSLGGLIARLAASNAQHDGYTLGRIVLLGSPAGGSAIAEALKDFTPFRMIAGDCGQAVTPLRALQVPVPPAEIAIIAGGNGKRGYNPFLRGDNDGIVKVAETRLNGSESGFLLLPSIHPTLPMHRAAVTATLSFLETGNMLAQSEPQPRAARS